MKFFRLIGCALFLRRLHPIVLMISMTNSMLTTLNNSALRISKDKHVGYVLSMFCISLRRPVVKLRLYLAWLSYCDAFFIGDRSCSCWTFPAGSSLYKVCGCPGPINWRWSYLVQGARPQWPTHPRAEWKIRFNCKWSPVCDNIVVMEIQLPSYLSDYRGGRFKYRNFKELDNK